MSRPDVFISYSHVDAVVADAIVGELEASGIACWYGPRETPAGFDFGARVIPAIKSSRLVLLIYSRNALLSRWVIRELWVAVEEGKTIVPVCIDEVPPEGSMRLILTTVQLSRIYRPPIENHCAAIKEDVRRHLTSSDDAGVCTRHSNRGVVKLLDKLRDAHQITARQHHDTAEFIANNPPMYECLRRRDATPLLEMRSTTSTISSFRVLFALIYGLELKRTLLGIDFELIPPGAIAFGGQVLKNPAPFYLSRRMFVTGRDQSSMPINLQNAVINDVSDLCLADAYELLAKCNERLDQWRRALNTEAANCSNPILVEATSTATQERMWFRLPQLSELNFVAAAQGGIPAQLDAGALDLGEVNRHVLGIEDLLRVRWQFCESDDHVKRYVWGGSHTTSPHEFRSAVPLLECLNESLTSPHYALRVALEVS